MSAINKTISPEALSPIARLEMMTKQKQARMLKMTLELVRQKLARRLPLTVEENELLAECRRRYYSKPKETITLDNDGRVIVRQSMDIEPIMDAMKAYGDIIGTKRNDKMFGAKMIGGIDPLTAGNWASETGLKVGTREFAQFAKKRIQDSEYRKFRVGH